MECCRRGIIESDFLCHNVGTLCSKHVNLPNLHRASLQRHWFKNEDVALEALSSCLCVNWKWSLLRFRKEPVTGPLPLAWGALSISFGVISTSCDFFMRGRFNYAAVSPDVGLHFYSLLRDLPIVRARVCPTLVIETPPPNVSYLALDVSFSIKKRMASCKT